MAKASVQKRLFQYQEVKASMVEMARYEYLIHLSTSKDGSQSFQRGRRARVLNGEGSLYLLDLDLGIEGALDDIYISHLSTHIILPSVLPAIAEQSDETA
jgi:hypothetical protein